MTLDNHVTSAPSRHHTATSDLHGAGTAKQRAGRSGSNGVIVVRCESPGVVLVVRGGLDPAACELLRDVVKAALVAVGYANRIRLDLSRVVPVPERLPRIVRRLERAGAVVTKPSPDPLDPPVGIAPPHSALGGLS